MGVVTLTTVPSELEAEMVCGLLRSAGIDAFQRVSRGLPVVGAQMWQVVSSFAPHEVVVEEHDVAAARDLLAASSAENEQA